MNTVAPMVYRVRQQNGKLLVEGKAAAHACRLAAAEFHQAACRLLANPIRFAALQSTLPLA
jgi:hypothetical protein